MSIQFPTNLDSFVNPNPNDPTTNPSHALQHDNENDAIVAIETKLGIDGSAVHSTIDWILKNAGSIDPGHLHTIASIIGLQNTLNSIVSGGQGGTKLAIDTTHVATSFGVESTFYTIPIPAGTLGTNDAIKFRVLISAAGFLNGDTFTVRVRYGGQILTSQAISTNDYKTATYPIEIAGIIVANVDTQKQNAMTRLVIGNGGATVGNGDAVSYGTGTVDSSVIQNLVFSVETSGLSGSSMIADGIVVEQLKGGGGAGKIAIDPTQINARSTGSYTIPIPGGILGNNNAIRYKLLLGGVNFNMGDSITVTATYGGNPAGSGTIGFRGSSSSFSNGNAFCEGVIISGGTTSTQTAYLSWGSQVDTSEDTTIRSSVASPNVDSTVTKNLVVTLSRTNSGDVNAYGIIVEKIM